MEAHVIASSSKGTELIPPRSDGLTVVRSADVEVTSEGEEKDGLAWPYMTFVSAESLAIGG
jgi:hypothetical protein